MIYLKMPDGKEYDVDGSTGELVVPNYKNYAIGYGLEWFINRWSYYSRVRGGSNEDDD